MMTLLRMVLTVAAMSLCLGAQAESTFVEVWQCTLNEGKTPEDALAANRAWLEFVNANVDGGGVTSSSVVPVVGEFGNFLYVDRFPSLAAWAQVKAALDTEEGQPINAAFNDVVTCTSNTLMESTQN